MSLLIPACLQIELKVPCGILRLFRGTITTRIRAFKNILLASPFEYDADLTQYPRHILAREISKHTDNSEERRETSFPKIHPPGKGIPSIHP